MDPGTTTRGRTRRRLLVILGIGLAVLAFFAVVIVGGYAASAVAAHTADQVEWDKRGNAGDSFGVMNTLLSGLAFVAIIVTLWIQFHELRLQRSELKMQREAIQKRLTELWNYERMSAPSKDGGRYFFSKNDGLQNQAVLYTQDSLDAPARVLLDPNTWSKDGTVALAATSFSDDGKYLAYSAAEGGSDWNTWRILEIDSGRLLPDEPEALVATSSPSPS